MGKSIIGSCFLIMTTNTFKKLRSSLVLLEESRHEAQGFFLGNLFSALPLTSQLDRWDYTTLPEEISFSKRKEQSFDLQEKLSPALKKELPSLKRDNPGEGLNNSTKCLKDKFIQECDVKHKTLKMSDSISKKSEIDVLFVGGQPKGDLEGFESAERELLEKMALAMKLKNGHAVTLSIKSPLDNEEDLEGVRKNCFADLQNEIKALKPQFVIPMGAVATNMILERRERLSKVHGEFFKKSLRINDSSDHKYMVVPIFHPEFLLINPNMKRTAWLDLKKVIEYLQKRSCEKTY